MIVITGAAGFIGSQLAKSLNDDGIDKLVLIDDFSDKSKTANYSSLKYLELVERDNFENWLKTKPEIDVFYHIGARTDTTEFNRDILKKLNLDFSKMVWNYCSEHKVKLIYASSAATYGGGEHGYSDEHSKIHLLKPLNPYGDSKQEFDLWALDQPNKPDFWYGLKFFNVYGPGESHKERMASVVYHAFNQIKEKGEMKLFRSHNPDYKDGEQLRDFIYVKDVIKVCKYLAEKTPENGIYNLGTGKARTFVDLVHSVFNAMEKEAVITFIDTPEDIRDKYQYFTEADMSKLLKTGYDKEFYSLEKGVSDYVKNHLLNQ